MNTIKNWTSGAAVLFALLCFDGNALAQPSQQPMTGTIERYGWSFQWSMTSTSGLRLLNVRRNGTLHVANASMPVIRVQYDNNCGPFMDRIKWDNIVPAGAYFVRSAFHVDWIHIWVVAQIDQYSLTQGYWLSRSEGSNEARIVTELISSGLQCPVTHRHHVYWRFDIDVKHSNGNRSWTLKNGVYTQRFFEFNSTRASVGPDIVVTTLDDTSLVTNLRAWTGDGTHDTFANWNVGGRKYPANTNDPWFPSSPGAFVDVGDLEKSGTSTTTNNGETMDNTDLEYWYVGHLFHSASQGPGTTNVVGPTLFVADFP